MWDRGFPRLLVRYEEEEIASTNFAPLLLQCATILRLAKNVQKLAGIEPRQIVMPILIGGGRTAFRLLVYLDENHENDIPSVHR
jgi:hypothetical protein